MKSASAVRLCSKGEVWNAEMGLDSESPLRTVAGLDFVNGEASSAAHKRHMTAEACAMEEPYDGVPLGLDSRHHLRLV